LLKFAKIPSKICVFRSFLGVFMLFYGFFFAGLKTAKFAWNGRFWLNTACKGRKKISSFFQLLRGF